MRGYRCGKKKKVADINSGKIGLSEKSSDRAEKGKGAMSFLQGLPAGGGN